MEPIRLVAMLNNPNWLFSHDEPDHLTRIHARFELEALGFHIEEEGTNLLVMQRDEPSQVAASSLR